MVDESETAMSLTNGLEKAEFLADRTLVDASIKNLSVLGEAATHMSELRQLAGSVGSEQG
jgi:uncharacterized protein with HEPN domain